MSVEGNKAVAHRFYDEVVNERNLALADELVADDFVDHEQHPTLPAEGPEAVKQAFTIFFDAFPDLRISIEDTIAEGDKVVTRGTMSGTHKGDFMGIPATDESFSVQVVDIVQFRDGKAMRHWGLTDTMTMMQQLGLAPEM